MTDLGSVNANLEPVIRLRVRGPSGIELEVPAVVNTGYTGSLAMPASVVAALGLMRRAGGRAVLADGSVRRFDIFAAEVLWGGMWIGIDVSVLGTESLLGMLLLSGRGLWLEAVSGGAVEVRSLTARTP